MKQITNENANKKNKAYMRKINNNQPNFIKPVNINENIYNYNNINSDIYNYNINPNKTNNGENQVKKIFFNKLDQNFQSNSPRKRSKSKSRNNSKLTNLDPNQNPNPNLSQKENKELGSDLLPNPNDDYQTLSEKNNILRELIIKANEKIINLVNKIIDFFLFKFNFYFYYN